MDSRIGLDYIVENAEYAGRLASALDTPNTTVKKQVFELLSALCAYNSEGYARALDTLERYKNLKGERYRLKVVVSELERTNVPEYQAALVAFINCVVSSATPQDLSNRVRARNEFIGLNLLSVLNNVRKEAAGDLAVQLEVFDDQLDSDNAQTLRGGPLGVDLNSPLDVFYAILRQVAGTPQEIQFLSILQHLLRIDPKDVSTSDLIWDAAETLLHRATLLESETDAARLLRRTESTVAGTQAPGATGTASAAVTAVTGKCAQCSAAMSGGGMSPGIRKSTTVVIGPPPPPPPPMMMMTSSISNAINNNTIQPNNNLQQRIPAPPPCPPPMVNQQSSSDVIENKTSASTKNSSTQQTSMDVDKSPSETCARLLPQQETPIPKTKMKTINWNKIPESKVVGKNNIWSLVANTHQHSPMADLDWAEMEGLFCQPGGGGGGSAHGSPRMSARNNNGGSNAGDNTGGQTGTNGENGERLRSRKENSEITLLDGKRSLNVNIFLKQFRSSNDDIIQLIKEGVHEHIGAEKLRGLLKILPEVDELDMLKSFDGDRTKLGNAEKFLMQLIQLPNYKLRIESMLLKEEFATNLSYLEPSINAMIYAGDDLMTNKPLQEVLYMVLVAGNFLNSGGYAGNAAGVKLSSLQKLTDIRANKPGMNLIHYVALQAQRKNEELLRFPDQMTVLESASKTTVEQLHNEINALDTRIKKIKKQIDLPTTELEIKNQMGEFLQIASREVSALQRSMTELEGVRKSLSEFFCEDPASFKLEDCLRVFHGFCARFRQAVAENERRRLLEERAAERRKQREEQLGRQKFNRQFAGQLGTPTSDSDNNLVDCLFYESRTGFPQVKIRRTNGSEEETSLTGSPALTRRRFGSFNSGGPIITGDINRDDNCASPDVTPNGSLRRRRSRVLSEEDEGNLMNFLRASGHDSTRERKSWGSLDRSWARRARTGSSSRKRPDLLNTDWSEDRERANSPSPLIETKEMPGVEHPEQPAQSGQQSALGNKPRYVAKEWRQKIESWLQANEKEDQQNQDLTRRARRIPSTRRSLEDSESERSGTLDPLPEGKLASHAQAPYKRVYTDWKSSAIDKTDVVRTMEAIEEAQPQQIKDKSAWRKSTLNVPNSTEETEAELRRSARRQRAAAATYQNQETRQIPTGTGPLNSINEEDDRHRKIIIASLGERPATDKLTLYMRLQDEGGEDDHREEARYAPRRFHRRSSEQNSQVQQITNNTNETISNKTEIDSDNIETPPATRRVFSPSREMSGSHTRVSKAPSPVPKDCGKDHHSGNYGGKDSNAKEAEGKLAEVLGDGQFDRFSSARRTRRYKRSTDYASGNDDSSPKTPESMPQRPSQLPVSDQPAPENCDKETRLKIWQERLKSQEHRSPDVLLDETQKSQNKEPKWPRISEKAIRGGDKIPPPTYRIRDNTDPLDSRQNDKEQQQVIRIPKIRTEHDLNDEGFEETQSLVSESPSQGTSSGCNYETDAVDTSKATDVSQKSETENKRVRRTIGGVSDKLQTLIDRNNRSLARSKSMRSTTNPSLMKRSDDVTRKTIIPRRSTSLRKTDSQNSVASQQRRVERSNSRASLRSSRSSLNSSASVNTVKKVPLVDKTPILRVVNRAPVIKRSPIPLVQNTGTGKSRVPASRSSSSGSSVGPTVIRKPPIRVNGSSFKENQSQQMVSKPVVPASRSSSSGSSIARSTSQLTRPANAKSGFMRPTASSATKSNAAVNKSPSKVYIAK